MGFETKDCSPILKYGTSENWINIEYHPIKHVIKIKKKQKFVVWRWALSWLKSYLYLIISLISIIISSRKRLFSNSLKIALHKCYEFMKRLNVCLWDKKIRKYII